MPSVTLKKNPHLTGNTEYQKVLAYEAVNLPLE